MEEGMEAQAAASAGVGQEAQAAAPMGQGAQQEAAGAAQQQEAPKADPKWFSQISPELRESEGFREAWGDCATMTDAIRKAESQKVDLSGWAKLPTKDSSPEEIREWLGKIGVPTDRAGYRIKDEDKLCVPGYHLSESFKSQCYRYALNNEQANAMWRWALQFSRQSERDLKAHAEQRRATVSQRVEAAEAKATGFSGERLRERAKESEALCRQFLRDVGVADLVEGSGLDVDEGFVTKVAAYMRSKAPIPPRDVNTTVGGSPRQGGIGSMYGSAWNAFVGKGE